jgi:DNA-binding NarL/FixJ family response regulator
MSKNLRRWKPVRVFVADSSALECQLMVRGLQKSGKLIKVVGYTTESAEILKQLSKGTPNVAIISADLEDGRSNGLQIVEQVRESCAHVRIIVLVESPERAVVVEAFRVGADGVFSRHEPFEMLCKCIHAVSGGQIWASSDEMRFVIEAMSQSEAQSIRSANGAKLLTKREEELVQLVAEGLTNRDISHQLSLTEHTVRNYMFRIFNKLGTSNRLELALYVINQRSDRGSVFGGRLLAQPKPTLSSMSEDAKHEIPSERPAFRN